MRNLILAALAAGTLATPALAQDATPFSGPRGEGVVGWDHLSDDNGTPSSSSSGVVYGGALGYDVRSGNTVFGPEVELTGASTDTRTPSLAVAGDEFKLDAGRDLYAGVRAGVVVGDSTLLYAKGGYTNARVDYRYTNGAVTIADGRNMDGWRVGAGVEQQLGGKVYLKGEYRYSDYGKFKGYNASVDRNQVVAGIGVRF
ncbi:outer membrane beta-barrel protein [Sphingomonas sp.]|uniref:outer membrane protein n=1 Tax=Sphingomonas sp. TaxID=28214 RepID=UPI001ECAB623|nr:outer membrane beta-barrel protein [Sphingomonas sp.]MBX3595566.1 porin family protein [Sphingomonas sp.]